MSPKCGRADRGLKPFGGHQHRLDAREVTIDELQLMAGSLTTLISRHWQYRPSRCYARDGRALNKEKGVAVCRCAGLSQFRLEKSFASWICQFMSSRWRPCGQAARENFSQLRPLTFSPPLPSGGFHHLGGFPDAPWKGFLGV